MAHTTLFVTNHLSSSEPLTLALPGNAKFPWSPWRSPAFLVLAPIIRLGGFQTLDQLLRRDQATSSRAASGCAATSATLPGCGIRSTVPITASSE